MDQNHPSSIQGISFYVLKETSGSRATLKYFLAALALLAVFASTSSHAASATEVAGTCVIGAPPSGADWDNLSNVQGASDDVPASVVLS